MVEWSTSTIVTTYLKGSGTSLTAAEIDDMIEQAEAFVKVVLKIPTTFTFDSGNGRHLYLRDLVTTQVARRVIASTPQSHNTLAQAQLTLDVLEEEYQNSKKFLADSRGYFEFISE